MLRGSVRDVVASEEGTACPLQIKAGLVVINTEPRGAVLAAPNGVTVPITANTHSHWAYAAVARMYMGRTSAVAWLLDNPRPSSSFCPYSLSFVVSAVSAAGSTWCTYLPRAVTCTDVVIADGRVRAKTGLVSGR